MRPAGGTDGTEAAGGEAGRKDAGRKDAGRGRDAGRNGSGRIAAGGGEADADAAAFRSAVAEIAAGLGRIRELRPELTFEQEPAPRRLAPYAASVTVTAGGADGDVGWGRLVLLFDPAGQRGWGGPFRIIGHIRVDLEPEIAADPLVGAVGWSWLTEALDARAVGYQHPSGTVTRVVTEGFGAKQDESVTTEFELRASWSPAWPPPASSQPLSGRAAHNQSPPGRAAHSQPSPGRAAHSQPPPGRAVHSQPPLSQPAGPADDDQPGRLGLGGHVAAWCEALCAAAGLPPLAAGVSALRQPRGRPR
jgi:hypothetical protein